LFPRTPEETARLFARDDAFSSKRAKQLYEQSVGRKAKTGRVSHRNNS
jgi:hypothetical protein